MLNKKQKEEKQKISRAERRMQILQASANISGLLWQSRMIKLERSFKIGLIKAMEIRNRLIVLALRIN